MRKATAFSVAALLIIVGTMLPTLVQRTSRTDLWVMVHASQRLLDRVPLYDLSQRVEFNKSPHVAMILAPLTVLPPFLVERLWDLLNLVTLVWVLLELTRVQGRLRRSVWMLAGLLCILHPFNTEIRLGQINFLGLALMLLAARASSPVAGLALTVALILKPVNLIFFPWTWMERKRAHGAISDLASLLFSALAWFAALSLVYQWAFGNILADVRSYADFLTATTDKNLREIGNQSLANALAIQGWDAPWISRVSMLLGILLAALASSKLDSRAALSVTSILAVLFSPISWIQNYCLLLPFALLAINQIANSVGSERWKWIFCLLPLYLGTQIYNPTTSRWWVWQAIGAKIPLIFLAATFAVFLWLVVKGEPAPNRRAD